MTPEAPSIYTIRGEIREADGTPRECAAIVRAYSADQAIRTVEANIGAMWKSEVSPFDPSMPYHRDLIEFGREHKLATICYYHIRVPGLAGYEDIYGLAEPPGYDPATGTFPTPAPAVAPPPQMSLEAMMALTAGRRPPFQIDRIDPLGVIRTDPGRKAMLTDAERRVLDLLAEAWNVFVTLPAQHPADNDEMARAIHDAQYRIAARVARRLQPDIWALEGPEAEAPGPDS